MDIINPNTLVSVHGYAGDAHQVRNFMLYYHHHKCPVMVLSPEDSRIDEKNCPVRPPVTYRFGGLRAYIGQLSLDRQKKHLEILLETPMDWFLMNDSDSVCLSPEIPKVLYKDENTLWANVVSDGMHDRTGRPDYPFPREACQPPYFCHRKVLEKIVAVADSVPGDIQTPFIDWCMMAWPFKAGVTYRNFPSSWGVSCPSTVDFSLRAMLAAISRNGAIFIHSIKTFQVFQQIGWARVEWKRRNRVK